jgi:hypothetical protein
VTPADFRRLALELPEAIEAEHMQHPDFRVRGKIFATLSGKDEERGMVKLTLQQQKAFVRAEPEVFETVAGAWGRGGATLVRLKAARKASVQQALVAAWRNTAPEELVREHERE